MRVNGSKIISNMIVGASIAGAEIIGNEADTLHPRGIVLFLDLPDRGEFTLQINPHCPRKYELELDLNDE